MKPPQMSFSFAYEPYPGIELDLEMTMIKLIFAASLKWFFVCILIGHQMGLGYMGLELCVY
jgi:hypothetical protein